MTSSAQSDVTVPESQTDRRHSCGETSWLNAAPAVMTADVELSDVTVTDVTLTDVTLAGVQLLTLKHSVAFSPAS